MKQEKRTLVHLTKEERETAVRWAADTAWMNQKRYEEDREYMECVRDIMEHPVFQSMEQFMQHGGTSCKSHCIQVSYMSYQICRKFGWNYREAARAGLLHDLFLYDWHTHARETGKHFHGFTHPKTALLNARKYFQLSQNEEKAILRHMWPLTPVPPKTMAGMSIVYSDKFCSLVETAVQIKRAVSARVMRKRYT